MNVHMAQNYHYQTTCITGKKRRYRVTCPVEPLHCSKSTMVANRNFPEGLVETVHFPIPEVNYVGQSDGQIRRHSRAVLRAMQHLNHSIADQQEEHEAAHDALEAN